MMRSGKKFWPGQQRRAWLLMFFLLALIYFSGILLAQEVQVSDKSLSPKIERLRGQIEQVARKIRGDVGVAIKHLESGEALAIKGDEPFPRPACSKFQFWLR